MSNLVKCRNCARFVHVNDDGERTAGQPNWCHYITDSPDEDIERECAAYKAKTNADRIRAMTDEELAKFISDVQERATSRVARIVADYGLTVNIEPESVDANVRGWCDWLKQEAQE